MEFNTIAPIEWIAKEFLRNKGKQGYESKGYNPRHFVDDYPDLVEMGFPLQNIVLIENNNYKLPILYASGVQAVHSKGALGVLKDGEEEWGKYYRFEVLKIESSQRGALVQTRLSNSGALIIRDPNLEEVVLETCCESFAPSPWQVNFRLSELECVKVLKILTKIF